MNILLKNISALLPENDGFKIESTDIYISGGKISGVGECPQGFTAEREINGTDRLVIPGLINTHTHAYMSIFRNIADDLAFDDWLFKTILPLEDKLTEEDIYRGTLLACAEMIRTGTTCFVDMNICMKPVMQAAAESGMRAVLSRGLVGNGNDEGGAVRIKETLDAVKSNTSHKISFLMGPHAPYSCDAEYLKIVTEAAKENNLGITIHLSESRNEIKGIKEKYGCTPIELMAKIGLFDVPTIAAHCVHVTDNDIDIMREKNVTVASNPISNLKLANGIAPIFKMQQRGVNVTIGTDSAASNNTLNMFSDMNYMSLLHKGINENSTALSATEVLKLVTENAARAIGRADLGKIEVGMTADLALIDLNTIPFIPQNNLISALAYSASGYEVDTVILGGDILMENKEFTAIDIEKIRADCEKSIARLRS